MAHITLGLPEPPPSSSQHGCRRRLLTILVSIVISVALAVAVSLAIYFAVRPAPGDGPSLMATTEAITRTCGPTLYPALCVSELAALPGAAAARDADLLVPMSLDATRRRVADALADATELVAARAPLDRSAGAGGYGISDCLEMLEAAADLLSRSVAAVTAPAAAAAAIAHDDVMTWLSAALTYHDTCRDGLHEEVDADGKDDGRAVKAQMLGSLGNLMEHLSNSLAIFKAWGAPVVSGGLPVQKRQLLSARSGHGDLTFPAPSWVKHSDRRLLEVPTGDMVPDMVVAMDGSGTHQRIGDAVEAAPVRSARRVVIYIKAGVYGENVKVARNKTNLMLVGDGAGQTVVVGRRSVADGLRTFDTATLSVSGDGFMMRDLTVENRAGPREHQAVALLVTADRAVAYRCAVVGYQDTLYAHAQRQLYRECEVAGTVDAVFGNAAAVLQNCTLRARRPLPGQKNTVTAQGRADPNQSTGFSVHACRLVPAPEYPASSTYLGRPWKPYARVVYMMSYVGEHVDAAGWLAWDASAGAPDDTVYYGEYQNYGPGAALEGRVAWPGHRVITMAEEAMEFTVRWFIAGYSWLPATGLPFVGGLTA
ncbi:hypothetical protein BDA96_03G005500 [Sorghum bicolor]|uniref:Pectinesterase inhibitor domain-containing protein n=2 Tax=Sorghum bicolor TaxID=4558 RepID=C5XJK9_SORBI|nr:hypothetical protein SORBI_3003G005400 [Sorghum bicolor]KAG0535743.1 hypothetical protein BDA96_03G005500 [Sorghum bicolor]